MWSAPSKGSWRWSNQKTNFGLVLVSLLLAALVTTASPSKNAGSLSSAHSFEALGIHSLLLTVSLVVQRSRGSRPAPRSAPASAPSGSRSASSVAAPPPVARAPPAASTGQPGMMAQMAATAGSVAVGSTVGHGISHMLFGGGGRAQEASDSAPAAHQQTTASGGSCEFQAKGTCPRTSFPRLSPFRSQFVNPYVSLGDESVWTSVAGTRCLRSHILTRFF